MNFFDDAYEAFDSADDRDPDGIKNFLGTLNTAKLEDIKPGAVLWHVYGFISTNSYPMKAEKMTVVAGPVPHTVVMAHDSWYYDLGINDNGNWDWREDDYNPVWFLVNDGDSKKISCRCILDCGINADYNNNRLFTSEEEANKFLNFLNRPASE